MKMLSASLTATSALIALVVSGFVPAPASVSLFGSAAEAKQPRQGSPKAKGKKPRTGAKREGPARKQRAKSQEKSKRQDMGETSKPKTTAVVSNAKEAAPSRQKSVAGNRLGAEYTTMAAAATAAVDMGLSAGSAGAARPGPPPLPPRARAKGAASSAKQAAKARKKAERRANRLASKNTEALAEGRPGPSRARIKRGKNTNARIIAKLGSPPNYPPPLPQRKAAGKTNAPPETLAASKAVKDARIASAASSQLTRIPANLGGGAPITANQARQAKQGKKSRFYFNPFRGWFGGGKKN